MVLLLLWAALPAVLSRPAAAAERIRRFHSLVKIQGDGTIAVTETISVTAEGKKIRRGIFRTFPTRYRNRFGNRVRVRFQVQSVRRDGRHEAFHIESGSKGETVYIGRESVFLDPGEHVYTLKYLTDRQIGFFENFDELYWNVTGNGWELPIEEASAEVRLPRGGEIINTVAYTGPKGARGRDYTVRRPGEDRAVFTGTRPLAPGEGLTIAVSWPKGLIPEPTPGERMKFFAKDNPSAVAALAGLLAVLLYFGVAWAAVGKDPPRGTVMTDFSPPEGYSPAAVGYVTRMGYHSRLFAAAVVDLAVKGFLKIRDDDGHFTLTRVGSGEATLPRGERRVAKKLFGAGESVELVTRNHRRVRSAVTALERSLRAEFARLNFRLNRRWLLPGALLTLLTLAGMVIEARVVFAAAFMVVWLGGWTAGCATLLVQAARAWRGGFATRGGARALHLLGAAAVTLFALPFLGGEGVGLYLFSSVTSPAAALVFLLVIGVNICFFHLLKAPTFRGRRVMDRIEGFRRYLEAAEADRMERSHPPEKTPELFEKYLPYALALGVENSWSRQFAGLLERTGEGAAYRPGWYTGSTIDNFSAAAMAGGLGGALAAAVSSSSSPPGSSSGSGGGGSSGGGGGGGGGGGW